MHGMENAFPLIISLFHDNNSMPACISKIEYNNQVKLIVLTQSFQLN